MNNYKFIEKILHSIALSNNFLRSTAFNLEKKLFENSLKGNIKNNNHIFITGLPRSGTTIILNYLYYNFEFGSLTYNDMPFTLSPNIWSSFSLLISKKKALIERAHKDGIKYNTFSPEAFEEIFWNTFSKKESLKSFEKYIHLILTKNQKERYLSKNNYNYKRLEDIHIVFPKANFLFIFRDPLQTSISLLKLHNLFLNLQNKNKFVRKYMYWLGHFEFGLDHKPWSNSIKFQDFSCVNYWLEQWYLFYEKALKKFKKKKYVIFINYESLNSKKKWKKIFKKINLKDNDNVNNFKFNTSIQTKIPNYDKKLYKECEKIYNKLIDLS